MEGITRFEDRYRLPVGISVNMTSFAAKLLTQVMKAVWHRSLYLLAIVIAEGADVQCKRCEGCQGSVDVLSCSRSG